MPSDNRSGLRRQAEAGASSVSRERHSRLIGVLTAEAWPIFLLFAIRGCGIGATFLTGVLIARTHGTTVNGLFQVGVGYVMVSAAVARLGQDQLNLRRMAELKVLNDLSAAHGHMRGAVQVVIPAALLAAVGVAAFAFMDVGKEAVFLASFGTAVIPFALLWVVTEGLRGWQFIPSAMLWQGAFIPVSFCAVLLLLALSGTTVPTSMLPFAYAACTVAALLGSRRSWRRLIGAAEPHASSRVSAGWRSHLRSGRDFWVLAIFGNILGWLDLLLLYAMADAREVGIFFAIVRTGALIATALNIAAAGIVARSALLYADGRLDEFAGLVRRYWIIFVTGAAITAALFSLMSARIAVLWGPEVESHTLEFNIYLLVQLLQAMFILPQLIATVVGLERKLIRSQFVLVPFKAAAIYVGYMQAGLLGVVVGVGTAMVASSFWTTVLFVSKMRREGMSTSALLRGVG